MIKEFVSYYKGAVREKIINTDNKSVNYKFDTGLHYYNGEGIKDIKWCNNSVFILYHSIEWGDFIRKYSLDKIESESIFLEWEEVNYSNP